MSYFFVRAIRVWLYPVQRVALAYGFKSQHDTIQLCRLYLQSVIIRITLGKTARHHKVTLYCTLLIGEPQCVDTDVGTASRKLCWEQYQSSLYRNGWDAANTTVGCGLVYYAVPAICSSWPMSWMMRPLMPWKRRSKTGYCSRDVLQH